MDPLSSTRSPTGSRVCHAKCTLSPRAASSTASTCARSAAPARIRKLFAIDTTMLLVAGTRTVVGRRCKMPRAKSHACAANWAPSSWPLRPNPAKTLSTCPLTHTRHRHLRRRLLLRLMKRTTRHHRHQGRLVLRRPDLHRHLRRQRPITT